MIFLFSLNHFYRTNSSASISQQKLTMDNKSMVLTDGLLTTIMESMVIMLRLEFKVP